MATLVRADGIILEQILETMSVTGADGLSRTARRTLGAALARTTWGRRHQHQMALMDGPQLLASAVQYDLTAIHAGRPIRVCGIGHICPHAAHRADEAIATLIRRLCAKGRDEGASVAMLFSDIAEPSALAGFDMVRLADAELHVTESSRHGAPMTLIRGGELRDLDAVVAMGRTRAASFPFHLDRDVDFVQYVITRKRLLAGLEAAGVRELHFFIAEEGITAAAYVVVSVVAGSWTLEECGDRDPSGARVGAILQALIARAPSERRPTIRGWLPRGFLPPQVTIAATTLSTSPLRVRVLDSSIAPPPSSAEAVLYWRNDLL